MGKVGYLLERYKEVHRGLERMGKVGSGWLSKLG